MLFLSPDFGITFDEWNRQTHGERIWGYYRGEVPASEFAGTASRLYGGFFDVAAVGLQRVLPLDPFVVRHGLNATFGWLGVVACGAWATRIGGPGVGLLAMAFLALLPRYFGHAMNNPKDIPFAALATAALYVISRIPARYPFLTWARVAGLALTIGLALGVRPGGMLLLGYAGVALAVQVARSRDFDPLRLAGTAARFALMALLAMTVPLPFWPWLQTRPFIGLTEALADVSNFAWNGSVLLAGRDVLATALPWTYVPTWLLYTTPLVGLAGLALSLAHLRPQSPLRLAVLGLWAVVLFPILYVIARHSTLYGGLRHLLFVEPPLAILMALGWAGALRARRRALVVAVALGLALGLAEPMWFQLRNHPNQVVYFNALAGGPRGAFGRFDLDYWGNCMLQAQREVARLARRARVPVPVTVSGFPWDVVRLNGPRVPGTLATPPESHRDHVGIVLVTGSRAKVLEIAARSDIIARITTADGALLCALVPGPAWPELERQLRASTR
jgi:hypothetical protein